MPIPKRHIGREGLALIKVFEGLRLFPYLDVAGKPTIGYGHLIGAGRDYSKGITMQLAESLLLTDLGFAESAVCDLVNVDIEQNEFDALVSFTFNLGAAALKKSSVLRYLNKGDRPRAAGSFLMWDKARDPRTGKLVAVAGLSRRRASERALFLTPDPA